MSEQLQSMLKLFDIKEKFVIFRAHHFIAWNKKRSSSHRRVRRYGATWLMLFRGSGRWTFAAALKFFKYHMRSSLQCTVPNFIIHFLRILRRFKVYLRLQLTDKMNPITSMSYDFSSITTDIKWPPLNLKERRWLFRWNLHKHFVCRVGHVNLSSMK